MGSGPGDPDLLTVKALRLIQSADVIFYDRLVSDEILALIPTGVSRFMVGKASGHHCVPQHEINQLLINAADKNRTIVRLKGGDPYIFGRGSEEALELNKQGIKFEVIPGITAASGCSSYAGIPLTHRGMSRSVQFITGHFREDEPLEIDWEKLVNPQNTLVFYMGLSSLDFICQSLMKAGLAADTAAAAVQNGTTMQQNSLISDVSHLTASVKQSGMQAPVMIIIGEVVTLADDLNWFISNADEFQSENTIYESVPA
ncbi:MAG: uroporphyrinogen-III C-methyltransferase [Gammaproteobacteria bacterium]|nr:uroporphyrinogen-III C-methyltransferase [Gammaproteobacteria bacterium]